MRGHGWEVGRIEDEICAVAGTDSDGGEGGGGGAGNATAGGGTGAVAGGGVGGGAVMCHGHVNELLHLLLGLGVNAEDHACGKN